MEKHKCKLCLKSFANGRALGGHMRSHMLNLYVPPKTDQPIDRHYHHHHQEHQLGEETESAQSSSSSSEDEDKGLGYELRENPKKSIRLVDPEFSFAGSVVLQDRESETESSKNPIQRRSKRIRKHEHRGGPELKMLKLGRLGSESEPVSSISDTTPEEDVAYCLMMLSRDKWMRDENEVGPHEAEQEKYIHINININDDVDEDDDENQSEESDELKYSKARVRKKYKCETCKKLFRSYQALGGHRASHKKIKLNKNVIATRELAEVEVGNPSMPEEKVHECPVCYRVFSSGQALGGHKRSHVTGSAPIGRTNTTGTSQARAPTMAKFGESLIDLNLPAPIDDDEISQIELSAVSDAEFVNPIKR